MCPVDTQHVQRYRCLMTGQEVLESALHAEFSEYLNAEVVLRSIVNVNGAIAWLKSTYLYVRVGASSGMEADNYAEAGTVAIREWQ